MLGKVESLVRCQQPEFKGLQSTLQIQQLSEATMSFLSAAVSAV